MWRKSLEVELGVINSREYCESLTWLSDAHYDRVFGQGALRGDIRATLNGRLYFHLLRDVIAVARRREMLPILLHLASHKAKSTRRPKVAGGGVRYQTRHGTPSVYKYPRPFRCLRFAREGFCGYEGVGRATQFGRPTAWTRDNRDLYQQLVRNFEYFGDLFRRAEPVAAARQGSWADKLRRLIMGRGYWSQAVANLNFPMTCHSDGNLGYSAQVVYGDDDGGFVIFPEVACAVAVHPTDLLIFDGNRPHGVGPFAGFRLSLVAYLKPNIFRCPQEARHA